MCIFYLLSDRCNLLSIQLQMFICYSVFFSSNSSTHNFVTQKNFVPLLLCLLFPRLQATCSPVHLSTRLLVTLSKKASDASRTEAQSLLYSENGDSQKDAACNSAFILSKHAAKRSQVFSPAFLIPLLYWRIKDGLIPALLAISVTLRKLKQLKNECKSYL